MMASESFYKQVYFDFNRQTYLLQLFEFFGYWHTILTHHQLFLLITLNAHLFL